MDNFNKDKCRICNNEVNNKNYIAQEMMFGLREEFIYFQCSQCNCLQIAEVPSDIRPYYSIDNYYSYQLDKPKISFKSKIASFVRKNVMAYYINKLNILGFLSIYFFNRYKKAYKWINQLKGVNKSSDILDVGCGTGLLLLDLNKLGYTNLTGIDPFIEKDINYPSGLQIFKKNIFDLDKKYDFIMLNHSFEHMDNPHSTFEQLHKLLHPDGRLLIRIPVVDSFSWRKYGVWWFQLDAPRHFYLHTVRSMAILAKNHSFKMLNIDYDSNEDQFYFSEKYLRDISLFEKIHFSSKLIRNWKKKSKWLNSINDGDQACFNFKRIN